MLLEIVIERGVSYKAICTMGLISLWFLPCFAVLFWHLFVL